MNMRTCMCGLRVEKGTRCLHGGTETSMGSTLRSKSAEAKRKREAERVNYERIGIGQGDQSRLSEVVARFDPVTAFKRRRAQKAANKSHAIGSRR